MSRGMLDLRFSHRWLWIVQSSGVITLCSLEVTWCLEEHRLHHLVRRVSKTINKQKQVASWFLAWLTVRLWRWKRYVPPKCPAISKLHGSKTKKTNQEDRIRIQDYLNSGSCGTEHECKHAVTNVCLVLLSKFPEPGSTRMLTDQPVRKITEPVSAPSGSLRSLFRERL
jgi:hypothetical protein